MTSKQLTRFSTALGPIGESVVVTGFTTKIVFYIQNKSNRHMSKSNFLSIFTLNKKRSKQENLANFRKNHLPEVKKANNTCNKPLSRYTATKGNEVFNSKQQKLLAEKIGSTPENFRFSLKNEFKCNGYTLARIVEGQDKYYN